MAKRHIRQFDASAFKYNVTGVRSNAIRTKGDFVFFRGQSGLDLEGNFVGHGDPGAQTEQACKNIKQLIEEAGGDIEDVCRLMVFVTDASYRPAVYAVISKYFERVPHCGTGAVVKGLALPEMCVEIEALAVIDT